MTLRRVRSRWMWMALAAVGLIAVVWLIVGRDSGTGAPAPTASASASAEQVTLLLQVRNDDGLAVDNVIAGADGGVPATQVLVPSRLVVTPAGGSPQTLAATAGSLDRSTSQDALSDLLALRIDGTLSLARLALAGMVDYVGGITLDVDQAITTTDAQTGQKVVVVAAGNQHLDGTQAAAYALAWMPGESESARLGRYSAVLTATVAALPADQLRIGQMLTSLGGSARTTTSTSEVAAFLLTMRAGILAGDQSVNLLPTTGGGSAQGTATSTPSATSTGSDAASGTGEPSASASGAASGDGDQLALVRLDLPAAQKLLERVLPTALLDPNTAKPRILLIDGVGTPGAATSAAAQLSGAGLVVVQSGSAATSGQDTTSIRVPVGAQGTQVGDQVAEALDVPASQVTTQEDLVSGADAVVVLGSDVEQ